MVILPRGLHRLPGTKLLDREQYACVFLARSSHKIVALTFLEDGNFSLELDAVDNVPDKCIISLQGVYSYDFSSNMLIFAPPPGLADYDIVTDTQGGSRVLCDALEVETPHVLSLQNTTVSFDTTTCKQWTADFGGNTVTWTAAAISVSSASTLIALLLAAAIAL